jgi:hypothetical protein
MAGVYLFLLYYSLVARSNVSIFARGASYGIVSLLFVMYIKRIVTTLWRFIHVSKSYFFLFWAYLYVNFIYLQNSFNSSYCRWFWARLLLTDFEIKEGGPYAEDCDIITHSAINWGFLFTLCWVLLALRFTEVTQECTVSETGQVLLALFHF